jgi:HK97 family phage prohead protease
MTRHKLVARLTQLEIDLYFADLSMRLHSAWKTARIRKEQQELLRERLAKRRAAYTQPEALRMPGQFYRSAFFERSSIDAKQRTIRVSASSDTPYERSFGTEILSHKPEHVRLKRLRETGPFLYNHNRDQHLGRVIQAEVDGHRLNALIKFSTSKFAAEKFEDIESGILRETSVGYEVHKMVKGDKEKSFIATDWEPYEISLVTVPADMSVGVGRGI